jgi:serine protease Do
MRNRFFPVLILLCAALVPRSAIGAQNRNNDGRFWAELPASAHPVRNETLPDFVTLAAKLSPTVVNISTEEAATKSEQPGGGPGGGPLGPFFGPAPQPSRSLGSGFVITKDGYILTNDHVVADATRITVATKDGTQYIAKVIGHDEKSDIALIKINPKHDLPVAPLGNSSDVKVGQWVMAIGNPFGFDHSVTVGIVSAKGRFIPGNYDDFIQTDASINPGNSGGPLIDLRGEVIGVNSAIYTRTGSSMGIGFAVPINIVKEELDQLRATGHVERGWLGVYIQRVTPDLAQSLGLGAAKGALVAEVLKDGPAKDAGVRRGDVIVDYDGRPVGDSRELPLMVGHTPIGKTATLKIIRDGKPIDLKVTIRPSREAELASLERPSKQQPFGTASAFGLYVKDLNPSLAKQMGLSAHHGVVISSVKPGSGADDAGLQARDIILEVNRHAVGDVKSYQREIDAGKGKVVLLLVKRGDNTIYVALKPKA